MNRTLKIFSISVVVLLLAHGVSAKPVDATRARRVAENYMQAKGMKNPSALADVTAQTPFTEFYVFASPEGGFVLVSGDDCAVPVLGYSLASRFETKDMPENVKGWLEGYENDIRLCRANALSGEPTASGDEWTMLVVVFCYLRQPAFTLTILLVAIGCAMELALQTLASQFY